MRQYNDNQYEEERANESGTTPRTIVRGTDNSRLLESRDTRIPDNVGTLTRTTDASRKRVSPPQEGLTSRKRPASPPGSPERPTYARTFTGDTNYNPQPQRVVQEIPRDTRVPNPLPLDLPEIVVLPTSDRIIDYELQTAAFRAQAAGGGPDPNAARTVRPPIPQYIHDRTSPINVPTVQFATPSAASTALVVGGRAVDDGSRPISTIALQTVLYVLNVNASGIMWQEAAEEFYEHSQRWTNNYDVGQVISTKAVRCIDDQIHTDQDYPYSEETRKVWLQTLTVLQVAALVLRYFRADTQLGQSLAEHFSEVHLAFCYNKREIEMRCMTQFREVVENHVQVHGILSTSDHAALTLILEKKMLLNAAITAKCKEHKRVKPHDVDDWEFAMRRFFSQVNAVRQLQLHVAAFGDPNDIYCHPARQNPYGLSLTTNPKTLLIGAALPA